MTGPLEEAQPDLFYEFSLEDHFPHDRLLRPFVRFVDLSRSVHALTRAGREANCLTPAAPTRFHATYVVTNLNAKVLTALRRIDPSVRDVRIVA